jgi:hypothetical protein
VAIGNRFGLTRRRFLGCGPAAALAAAMRFPASAATAPPGGEDYYAKLGVQPIINAAGTYTYLTAAVMPPSVRRAVEQAARHPVRLKDLQKASGKYLARKLRCEAALVSSGASAALTLATAACIAKANGLPPEAIPGAVAGHKNDVVVQKAHRYEYDHAMQLCNVVIKEVVSLGDYRAALSDRTVMTNFLTRRRVARSTASSGLLLRMNTGCHAIWMLPRTFRRSKTYGNIRVWALTSYVSPVAREFAVRRMPGFCWVAKI